MKFNIGILLILILLSVISFSNSNRVLNKDLFVDKELLRESISPALQEINEYTLRDLKPNSYYEIRISYPSTVFPFSSFF